MEINKTILDYYLQGETPTQISRLMNIPRDEVTYQINNAYKQPHTNIEVNEYPKR